MKKLIIIILLLPLFVLGQINLNNNTVKIGATGVIDCGGYLKNGSPVIGTTGMTGLTGAIGTTGAVGETGAVGATGLTGEIGQTGAIGATGATGITGVFSVAGTTGQTLVYDNGAWGATSVVTVNGEYVNVAGYISSNQVHAIVGMTGGTYTPTVTQNVYTKIQPTFAIIDTTGVTWDADTFKLYHNTVGDYWAEFTGNVTGSNNDDFTIQVRYGNVEVGITPYQVTTIGALNYPAITARWYLESLASGSYISFWVTNVTNNNDPTFRNLKVYIYKAH